MSGNGEISIVSGFAQIRTREIRSCDPSVSRVLSYGIRDHRVTRKAKQNMSLIFVSTREISDSKSNIKNKISKKLCVKSD